ncbi:MAG: dihydropteroate synthase [Candidatus Korobacteraceae bacterium]
MRAPYVWRLRSRSLELGRRTLVMGVVNVTPDSFSDGGKYYEPERAIGHTLELLDEGADILDVGGESTRPGTRVQPDGTSHKSVVTEEEELRRVMPVIESVLKARPDTVISIDTYKAGVAKQAVGCGAEIVNDVSAFAWDDAMAQTCADLQCGVVMMHTRGRPREWRDLPSHADVTALVAGDLANRAQIALNSGVARERIVLDPGFGFGKKYEENYPLLARFESLQHLGFPLLAGTSRKSFVGRTVGKRRGTEDAPANERLYGSLAAMVASILGGAHIVRVHEVRPAVEAAAVADEVLAAMME